MKLWIPKDKRFWVIILFILILLFLWFYGFELLVWVLFAAVFLILLKVVFYKV